MNEATTKHAVASVAEPTSTDRTSTAWPRRIVIAEDHDGMRRLLARSLRADGYEVIEACNGFELMHWVDLVTGWEQPSPLVDLIVTDLRMPIFSGLECMEQLRFGGSSVPVILITAFGDWQVHEQARVHGVRAVLDKPLDMVQLRTAVAEILR